MFIGGVNYFRPLFIISVVFVCTGKCAAPCGMNLDCGFCGMCYRGSCICAPACRPFGDSCGPVLNFNSALGGKYGGGYSNLGGYGSVAFGNGYRDDECSGPEVYPGDKCGYGCTCIGGSTCIASICVCPINSRIHNNICIIQPAPNAPTAFPFSSGQNQQAQLIPSNNVPIDNLQQLIPTPIGSAINPLQQFPPIAPVPPMVLSKNVPRSFSLPSIPVPLTPIAPQQISQGFQPPMSTQPDSPVRIVGVGIRPEFFAQQSSVGIQTSFPSPLSAIGLQPSFPISQPSIGAQQNIPSPMVPRGLQPNFPSPLTNVKVQTNFPSPLSATGLQPDFPSSSPLFSQGPPPDFSSPLVSKGLQPYFPSPLATIGVQTNFPPSLPYPGLQPDNPSSLFSQGSPPNFPPPQISKGPQPNFPSSLATIGVQTNFPAPLPSTGFQPDFPSPLISQGPAPNLPSPTPLKVIQPDYPSAFFLKGSQPNFPPPVISNGVQPNIPALLPTTSLQGNISPQLPLPSNGLQPNIPAPLPTTILQANVPPQLPLPSIGFQQNSFQPLPISDMPSAPLPSQPDSANSPVDISINSPQQLVSSPPIETTVKSKTRLSVKVGQKCYFSRQCTEGAGCLKGICQCGYGWRQEENICKFKELNDTKYKGLDVHGKIA